MRRIGIAAAVLAATGIAGTAVITTTHAAGLPLPIVGGGSGLPVVGGLPGLDGVDPVGTVVGAVAGMPGYVLNCGLMSNVPMLQHPATSSTKSHKTHRHTAPSMPTCGNGLPVVSQLPVVGGIAGGLPTSGLGGLTGGLPIVGDGSGLGGLPIGGLTGGLGGIAGLAGGLPIGGLPGLGALGGLGGLGLGG